MLLRLSVLGYPKNRRTIATGWNVLSRLSLRVLKKYENFCDKMQCAAQTLSFKVSKKYEDSLYCVESIGRGSQHSFFKEGHRLFDLFVAKAKKAGF